MPLNKETKPIQSSRLDRGEQNMNPTGTDQKIQRVFKNITISTEVPL